MTIGSEATKTTLNTLKLGFQVVGGASNVAKISKDDYKKLVTQEKKDVGKVYDRVQKLMDQRAVLCDSDGFNVDPSGGSEQPDPVVSPAIRNLQNLYAGGNDSGVIYVMYDRPGQGTTVAGKALLQSFYAFPSKVDGHEELLKGFMLTGRMIDEDYMSKLSDNLGATGVKGWIHALLLAMDAPETSQPSILILDSFNSLGKDQVNVEFIKGLCGWINGKKNLFVVVITQNRDVANKLCGLDDGQRVAPLPGCYSGEKTSPNWNEQKWGRSLLIEAIRYEYPGKFGDDYDFAFLSDDMTPLQATMAAATSLRTNKVPGRPRKKA